MSGAKGKQINIEEKSRIISKLESGVPNKDLAKEYGVSHSTISTIWNEREKIQNLYDKNFLKMKRTRTTKHTKIEEALLKWFKYQRTNNVPINGPILQQKANDFVQRFGEVFVCSSSWIQRFRTRHGIVGGKMSGEAASVPRYAKKPDDIFHADETGLFYNMTPDRTLKFKGDNCSGGKMSKTRLTIMVAANMTGSCRKKLLVIGKSKKPRCFKSVRSLPVTYENNVKSWMTSEIFERWLRDWDAELKANNKKVLLLVDNCPAHPAVTNLKFIKLVFLPPNVTYVLQPMDQGVLRCLKSHYRRMQVLKLIQNLDSNNQNSFTVIDAILMISEAWDKVLQKTIANCFRHAGFKDNSNLRLRD
ncbi:tigger transposable element-derived protein 4-like [Vanessa tameamea]|uniref:Tigger transposable element-derived protein 4-like n=1 Tax=Vanessa tameamea TaxID=334116 RepID=A0ABM4AJL8_VANTA